MMEYKVLSEAEADLKNILAAYGDKVKPGESVQVGWITGCCPNRHPLYLTSGGALKVDTGWY